MPLQPQAALETAVLDALRTATDADPAGLGYTSAFSGRSVDGRPAPLCGEYYAAVWHDGSRQAGRGVLTSLDEVHGVYVTLTVRTGRLPWDRWAELRDRLESLANAVQRLVHSDAWGYRIVGAANTLAGYRDAGTPGANVAAAGFAEPLRWEGTDAVSPEGPDHFHADLSRPSAADVGLSQRVRFGGCRRVQAIITAG